MTLDLITTIALFAFVTSITPGPNNIMLLASGARFGLRRTIPHMLGISIGFAVMVLLVGAGTMRLFEAMPVLAILLKLASLVFLGYLAVRLARAAPMVAGNGEPGDRSEAPMSFLAAALFQWVNPKAWAMALSAVTLYAGEGGPAALLLIAGLFMLVNLPSVSLWAYAGERLRIVLADPRRARAFNITMAILLIASVLPMLRP
jgi:threonine/homoserine/homoserine lactone efflux protein